MKVFLDSIGCRLNQSEIEKIAIQFRAEGHEIVSDPAAADIVVVNTCAVTAAASSDSRSKIRAASLAGKAKIVATGCYTTIDANSVAGLPSVEWLVPNSDKNSLVSKVLGLEEKTLYHRLPRKPLPGNHKRTRAFIKVQDGCDNFCTFCITRIARGKSLSQSEIEIFEDIRSALEGAAKEIVLTGVNLGSWGRDFEPKKSFANLIKEIAERYSPPRIRFSSLEPWDIDDELIESISLPGFCKHLHLPLQSGSDVTLRRMGRRDSTKDFYSVVNKLRNYFPEIAITTDVMVGFPGENDAEFKESLDFVSSMEFSGAHVFSFSSRPGTSAEKLPDQIPLNIKRNRSLEMRNTIGQAAVKYRNKFIGENLSVLWERSTFSEGVWSLSGLTENYLRVEAKSKQDSYNRITQVEIEDLNGMILVAREIV
jgi:threonylcarbamoyladenosine tRNA methylthiotransferase MtaB